QVPLLAKLHRDSLWQINWEWIAKRLGREASSNPRIWIAGCGTFQPYTFSRANPRASILATDLSEASLEIAKKRCRVHRIKNVEFAPIDLTNPATYPQEKFDLIECYGVLMSLFDPGKTLKEFAKRLKPNGLLRIMVYTHYGRQRIFQIQKLAKLLGLSLTDKQSPKALQNLMAALPENHPLKSTFFDYPDSKNLPGIVDGFLHASDRGFTGETISKLLDGAGFEFGFCYHRPWGDPDSMEKKLGFKEKDPAFWLHYLDLWQSLKSNFILCVVPKASSQNQRLETRRKHPLFDLSLPLETGHKLRLLRLSLSGAKLQSRTHEESIKLSGKEVRSLIRGQGSSEKVRLVLGEEVVKPRPFFQGEANFPAPTDPWTVELGKGPNPIYRHLFDAYKFSNDIEKEWESWKPHSRPLENEENPWGLTPAATFENRKEEIQTWLKTRKNQKTVPISEGELVDEEAKLESLRRFLEGRKGIKMPSDRVSQRVLWVLLMSHEDLFLEFKAP
ncbi:MAG: class I SAM-dependent methyltransferase, partial [Pseudomonadota bacterium]